MEIALVSLIILVLVIFIGFFRKINVGLVAILAVTIFGAFIGEIGSFTGRFSPITPESLLIQKLTEPQGITNYQSIVLIYASVTTIILSIIIFIIFKGYKVKTKKWNKMKFLHLIKIRYLH